VYVPQEHIIEGGWEMPNEEWAKRVFAEDIHAILNSDVVMILNFGMYSDSGTAWEAGYAYGMKIPTVQVLCGGANATYSLMMMNGCDKVIEFHNVANWEEDSANIDLGKVIQK
jgi:nucleoside 2-deoxyribosyltransferase